MANSLGTMLSDIASAIRNRNRGNTTYYPSEMADAIRAIRTDTDCVYQSKIVNSSTSAQTVTADAGYDGLSSVHVNAIAIATQATPSITVSNGGLITASSTQSSGYVYSGTKTATTQLSTFNGQTITPDKTQQQVINTTGKFGLGNITVEPASGGTVSSTTVTGAGSTSISFTVDGEPKAFSVMITGNYQPSGWSNYYVIALTSDGTNTYGLYYSSRSTTIYHTSSQYFWTYANGTLTITSSSSNYGYFMTSTYRLIYVY